MPRGDALCARTHLEESTFLILHKEVVASRHSWSRVIRVKSRCAIVETPTRQLIHLRERWIFDSISTRSLRFYIYFEQSIL